MKRILTTAGLVALGATGLQAAYAPSGLRTGYGPGLSRMETMKPWSISASLRGFYDDNYTTSPSSVKGGPPDSFGFEIRPSVGVNLHPSDQTYFGAEYTYSLKYYDDRSNNRADHTHEFLTKLDHYFSELYHLSLSDSLVYAQEPEVVDEGGAITTPTLRRTQADVFRNRGDINFDAQLTDLLGVALGYENLFYDYTQDGTGSRSALLDRLEHLINIDGTWSLREDTMALVGYQYGIRDFTSEDQLFPGGPTGNIRDSISHYVYVGAVHTFSKNLSGSVKAGAQYIDYEHLAGDTWSPYVDLNATYRYMEGSYVQGGFRHTHNATDLVGGPGGITLDAESSTFYASVNQKITSKLFGSVLAQFQNSDFNGGTYDGVNDMFYILGLNLEYRFTQHLSAEAGYNYDRLDSDVAGRSFTRNRVYLGVRATY